MYEDLILWRKARKVTVTLISNKELQPTFAASKLLAQVIGEPYPDSGFYEHIEYTPQIRNVLRQIAGPRGLTILKAYMAQKGIEYGNHTV